MINNFDCDEISEQDLKFEIKEHGSQIEVIEALDGQLITNKILAAPKVVNDEMVSDPANDILKMVVVNRYKNSPVAKGFVKNFGFKSGAIASSVAHDSHNIIAVGADDESICNAINLVIREKGGVSCAGRRDMVLPLPIAGLMSNEDGYKVAEMYTAID